MAKTKDKLLSELQHNLIEAYASAHDLHTKGDPAMIQVKGAIKQATSRINPKLAGKMQGMLLKVGGDFRKFADGTAVLSATEIPKPRFNSEPPADPIAVAQAQSFTGSSKPVKKKADVKPAQDEPQTEELVQATAHQSPQAPPEKKAQKKNIIAQLKEMGTRELAKQGSDTIRAMLDNLGADYDADNANVMQLAAALREELKRVDV